jgi:hypothetical protein
MSHIVSFTFPQFRFRKPTFLGSLETSHMPMWSQFQHADVAGLGLGLELLRKLLLWKV